jgi:inorganic pyrophosphatase
MHMNIDAIPTGKNPPDEINVIIEVPIGGEPIKYEMDKAAGALFVDRFLYTSMRYPGNYGFVPSTLSDDGDPIDVIVCNTRAIIRGATRTSRTSTTCRKSPASRSSISLSTTRIWSPANGSRWCAGAMRRMPKG